MNTWMRRRGDRVRITTGKYAGHSGTVESNVYQRTVDYPDDLNNGELVTVQWEQVEGGRGPVDTLDDQFLEWSMKDYPRRAAG